MKQNFVDPCGYTIDFLDKINTLESKIQCLGTSVTKWYSLGS